MAAPKSPRKGSLQYWPRKRISKFLPSVNWSALNVSKKQPQKSIKSSKTGLTSIQNILNETRMSMQSSMDDEWPEMTFTSDSIAAGRTSVNMIPDGYRESEITPEVSKALTRDYSALMAKINEKKGAG